MPYTFKQTPDGNVEVYLNNILKSTGTASAAEAFGYNNPNPAPPAPVQISSPSGNAPAVITSSGVQKDILQPIKDAIQPIQQDTSNQTPLTPPTPEDQILQKELDSQKTDIQKKAENDMAYISSVLDPLKSQLEATKSAQIETIKNNFSLLRTQAEEANRRRNTLQETIGVRFGGRFTPEHTADLVQDQVNQGISKIQELNTQEQTAINDINNAFDAKSYTLALKKFDALDEIRKGRDAELQKINDLQVAGLKKIQEAQRSSSIATAVGDLMKQGITDPATLLDYVNNYESGLPTGANVTASELKDILDTFNASNPQIKAIGDLVSTAINNGAPPDIISAMKKASTVDQAYSIGADYTQGGSGIIGEYNFYKAQALKAGQTPVNFNAYQTMDANRKAKAAAGISSNAYEGLPASFAQAAQAGKTGDELLNALDLSTKATIKSLLDYTKNPNNLSLRKGAGESQSEREKFLSMAHQIDPNYDESQYAARSTYNKSLQSGTIYQGLQAGGKVINHLITLLGAMDKIGNTGVSAGIPFTNISLNSLKADTLKTFDPTLQKAVKEAKTEADGVTQELAKFFKGTGVSDIQSIDEWSKNVSIFSTPAEQEGLKNGALKLLTGQLDVIYDSYRNTMGRDPEKPLIPQEALDKLQSMGIDISNYEGVPAGAETTNHIIQSESDAENTLKSYVVNHPDKQAEISKRIADMETSLGRPVSSADFLQAFPEYKN